MFNGLHLPATVAIQKMIESSKRMIGKEKHNPIVNKHLELEIKTLQNAPRDEDKLQALLKAKEREKEKAHKGWLQRD